MTQWREASARADRVEIAPGEGVLDDVAAPAEALLLAGRGRLAIDDRSFDVAGRAHPAQSILPGVL